MWRWTYLGGFKVANLERDRAERRNPAGERKTGLPLIYNWMSIIGSTIAAVGSTCVAFFVVIDLASLNESGYMGVTFLPPLVLALLGFVLVAAWRIDYNQVRPHSSLGNLTLEEFAQQAA